MLKRFVKESERCRRLLDKLQTLSISLKSLVEPVTETKKKGSDKEVFGFEFLT